MFERNRFSVHCVCSRIWIVHYYIVRGAGEKNARSLTPSGPLGALLEYAIVYSLGALTLGSRLPALFVSPAFAKVRLGAVASLISNRRACPGDGGKDAA